MRSSFEDIDIWKVFLCLILVIAVMLGVYKALVVGFQKQTIVFLNKKINSEVRIEQNGRFHTEEVEYFVGYYTLEDGGIKQFSMKKENTVIYYDLKEGEPCYAEYSVGILGIRTGEIKLHLHTVQNPISSN